MKYRTQPSYLALKQTGELQERGRMLWSMMSKCRLCPRECSVNRLEGQEGFCHASSKLIVASHHPHFGEEAPLVGKGGSGTIFFSNCSLRCVFCINWEISHLGSGDETSLQELADMMIHLQKLGCHNINLVTPTHYVAHIVLAVGIAADKGLRLPLVYNTCGWERLEILRHLDGVVDIYLPDFKYGDGISAARYSAGADSYPTITKNALLEMHRQVGVAKPDTDGIIRHGLMIRHLVMPNNVSASCEVIRWIAQNLPNETYVNIMSQYRPCYKALHYPPASRPVSAEEYKQVVEAARDAGLTNLDIQGFPI